MSVAEFVAQLNILSNAAKGADSWTDDRLAKFTTMFDSVEELWANTLKSAPVRADILKDADSKVSFIRSALDAAAKKRKASVSK